MVIETRTRLTDEELNRVMEEHNRNLEKLNSAFVEGIGARTLTVAERRGVEMLIDYVFTDDSSLIDDAACEWAKRLTSNIVGDVLLTKCFGVWYMEGEASDWKDVPDGMLGSALDHAAAMIRPYLRNEAVLVD